MQPEKRREQAIEAACSVAGELRIQVERPIILKDSNNTIVHLFPAPIVAKVGTSHFRDAKLESLERELEVARHLAQRGAPIIQPTQQRPAGPYHWRNLTLTLWDYAEPLPCASLPPVDVAAVLKIVHRALIDFPNILPPFGLEVQDARKLLRPERSPLLAEVDRRYLLDVIDHVEAEISELIAVTQPVHGSPHMGNWLATAQGPLLLDFETACQGPIEWDLAALDDDAITLFENVDQRLLALLRRMRSACVAAKCWVEPNRAPELFEAANVHLRLLRGQPLG